MTTHPRVELSTPDALVSTVYALISGRASDERDWERLRSLYAPEGRMIPVRRIDGSAVVDVLDSDSYEKTRRPIFAAADFYETETARRIDVFGDIAHVWSAYEARRAPDAEPFMRGVNSFQLLMRGGRWWIVSALWQNENGASITALSGIAE